MGTESAYKMKFELPSGKECILRGGKGRDVRLAMMAAGTKADPYRLSMALLAQLITVDGKQVPFEAIDDWDMADVFALMAKSREVLRPLEESLTTTTEEKVEVEQ